MSWSERGSLEMKKIHTEAAREPENKVEERAPPKLAAFLKAPAVSLDSIFDAGFWKEGRANRVTRDYTSAE